jgi:ABC-type sugar transport system substrate-binding protein
MQLRTLFLAAILPVVAGAAPKIGMMPKMVGVDYSNAMRRGALAAGTDLGIEVVFDGPVTNDPAKQAALVETWIAQKFSAICVAPNDPDAISPVLCKARARGIKVLTYDADAQPRARDLFVNQASPAAIGKALIDSMERNVGPTARYLIITGSLSAANQNRWMVEMEKYRQQAYPKMVNLSPTPKAAEEDSARATQIAIDVLKVYPDLQGIFAITSEVLPGAAEGLMKAGATGKVFLTGLSTPKSMSGYVKSGACGEVILWNPEDLGYLTVQVAAQLVTGKITDGSKEISAGKLGPKQIVNHEVLLGEPLVFTKANIDQYGF